MNYRSWIYRVSFEELCMMDYCNEVDDFINYTISNPKNISGTGIRYPCKMCENKKFLDLNIIAMHLLQKSNSWKIHMLVCTRRTMFFIKQWLKGWLGQLLILTTCMEL